MSKVDLNPGNYPPTDIRRWTAARKALIVETVRNKLMTREEALTRFGISSLEFRTWERSLEAGGVKALRSTRTQQSRRA